MIHTQIHVMHRPQFFKTPRELPGIFLALGAAILIDDNMNQVQELSYWSVEANFKLIFAVAKEGKLIPQIADWCSPNILLHM